MVTEMEKEYPKTIEELEAQFWASNKKPALIWRELGRGLKPKGYSWPIYLKLLGMRRDLIVLHENGDLSLALLLMEISKAARSPIGDYLLTGGG